LITAGNIPLVGSILCPRLISRDGELITLTTALDNARNGQGSLVFLTGDAGVGKSRLVKEACVAASESGMLVITGRAVDSTVPVPFRPVTEALIKLARHGVTPEGPDIADYRPALGSLVPEWSRPGDDNAENSAVVLGEAVLRLLSQAGPKGAVLVLEDLHWADPETLAIVEYLADNLSGAGVLCLATLRDGGPSPGLEAIRSAQARRTATRVNVARLTGRAVEEMAAACLGIAELPRAVARLLADCDGLPFAVEEILAAAVTSGELVRGPQGWHVDADVTTVVPASIAGSVLDRLAMLDPPVAEVIIAAAVLGRHFDWTMLPGLTGATESEVLAALRQAQGVQLVEPSCSEGVMFRFRHSLTRHAILSDLLPPDLASRSAKAAAAIENAHPGLPGNWCELAAELRAAAAQPGRAARLLLTAGRRALRRGALVSATALLRDAGALLAESPSAEPALALDVDEALVQALAAAGDYQQLAPLAESLIARLDATGADPRRHALVRITSARTRSEDHCATSAAHLAAARQVAENLHDDELVGRVHAAAALCALDSGDLDQAEELARRSLAIADAAGSASWAAEVAFESLQVIGRRERIRDVSAAHAAFKRAYQIATDNDSAVERINALHELGTIDMLRHGSASTLRRARELAQRAGAISTATVIDLQLAAILTLGTDLTGAMDCASRCEHGASRLGARRVEAMALGAQAAISGIRTHRREAELAAERAESILPGDPELLLSTWGWARVTTSLFADDDIARALREADIAVVHGGELGQRLPRRSWAYYALLHAVSDVAGHDALSRALAAGSPAAWNEGYLAYAEAVLKGGEGRSEQATALAQKGAALLIPYAPRWRLLAHRLVAPAALKDGWGQPVAWLREAAGEFESAGHLRLASACRGMLRRAGERVPRSRQGDTKVPPQLRRLGITNREMDVLLLVAEGQSNADIAARLFISPKTVETHVASLIAKTGQSCRRQLVAHAARTATA
jgi:DNA-binding CsgD family transcriptional regulator/tetratricopeptide (TPR) repeat protein